MNIKEDFQRLIDEAVSEGLEEINQQHETLILENKRLKEENGELKNKLSQFKQLST